MVEQIRKIATVPLNAWRLQASTILLTFFLVTQRSDCNDYALVGFLLLAFIVYLAAMVILVNRSDFADGRHRSSLSQFALQMAILGVAGTILLVGQSYLFPQHIAKDVFTGLLGLSWMPTTFAIMIGFVTRESRSGRWALGISILWLLVSTAALVFAVAQISSLDS